MVNGALRRLGWAEKDLSVRRKRAPSEGAAGAAFETEHDHDPGCSREAAADGDGWSLVAPSVLGLLRASHWIKANWCFSSHHRFCPGDSSSFVDQDKKNRRSGPYCTGAFV